MEDPLRRLDQLRPLFEDDLRIVAVYLFGSQVEGYVTPRSDIDLAILWCEPVTFRTELDLDAEISLALGTDKVDVVNLSKMLSHSNTASSQRADSCTKENLFIWPILSSRRSCATSTSNQLSRPTSKSSCTLWSKTMEFDLSTVERKIHCIEGSLDDFRLFISDALQIVQRVSQDQT